MRSLCTTTKSSPRSPQREKARMQQRRPNIAKNKLINFKKSRLVSAKFKYQRGLTSRLADLFFHPYTPLTLTSKESREQSGLGVICCKWINPEKVEGETCIPPMPQATVLRWPGSGKHQLLPPPVTLQPLVKFISADISHNLTFLKCIWHTHSLPWTIRGPPGTQSTFPSCFLLELCVWQEKPRSVLPSWAPSATTGTSLALRNCVGRKRNGMNKCLHLLLSADKH